jgi:hypothetical protein
MSPYAFPSICSSLVPVVVDVAAATDDVAAATTNVVASSGRPVMTCKHVPYAP